MPSPTLVDLASRSAPMAKKKWAKSESAKDKKAEAKPERTAAAMIGSERRKKLYTQSQKGR